ncbi:hypothetical protein ACIA5D_46015 [Actinoplanes sp. NPDC051513]|uniref:hypothetical protein n=1 Tax=Actinoplanes sp. NPDC051513 TaxID=3363908 RepID=UPI00379646DB
MTDIDAARYGRLIHAYGFATDTPGHLAALVDGDADARKAAQGHIWSAVIHQGTPWTVTPDAARVVASQIADPRLAGAENAALRANLLNFLAAVAEAGHASSNLDALAPPEGFDAEAAPAAIDDVDDIFGDEVLGNYVYAKAIQGCREVVPALRAAATAALSDPDPPCALRPPPAAAT